MEKLNHLKELIIDKAITSLENGNVKTVDSLLALSEIVKNLGKYETKTITDSAEAKGEML